MKASMIILLVLVSFSFGCSSKSKKKGEAKETPISAKEAQMKGDHMVGQAKELGKEGSIKQLVQTKSGDVKAAQHIAKATPVPTKIIPSSEYRCQVGEGKEQEKARKLNNEGIGYYRKGLYKAAITAFKYAHSLDCNYYIAKTNVASTLAKIGHHREAMGWLQLAYDMNSNKTIRKLNKDPDYKNFIREHLLDSHRNPNSPIAKDYLASKGGYAHKGTGTTEMQKSEKAAHTAAPSHRIHKIKEPQAPSHEATAGHTHQGAQDHSHAGVQPKARDSHTLPAQKPMGHMGAPKQNAHKPSGH